MNAVRRTSISAYQTIKESGLLSRLRFAVYEKLFEFGPLTQGELWHRHFPNRQRHDICPRFAELAERGVIECVGERPCTVTGVSSMVWDVNENLPRKPEKKQSKLELKIAEALKKERIACAKIADSWGMPMIGLAILERNKD